MPNFSQIGNGSNLGIFGSIESSLIQQPLPAVHAPHLPHSRSSQQSVSFCVPSNHFPNLIFYAYHIDEKVPLLILRPFILLRFKNGYCSDVCKDKGLTRAKTARGVRGMGSNGVRGMGSKLVTWTRSIKRVKTSRERNIISPWWIWLKIKMILYRCPSNKSHCLHAIVSKIPKSSQHWVKTH